MATKGAGLLSPRAGGGRAGVRRLQAGALPHRSPADPTSLGEEGMISLWRNFLCGETLENHYGGRAQCLSWSREPCPPAGCEMGVEHPSAGQNGPGFRGGPPQGATIATSDTGIAWKSITPDVPKSPTGAQRPVGAQPHTLPREAAERRGAERSRLRRGDGGDNSVVAFAARQIGLCFLRRTAQRKLPPALGLGKLFPRVVCKDRLDQIILLIMNASL